MSIQRGNYKKKGQKFQNTRAFKNDLHDNSDMTKLLNNMVVSEVCQRCVDIIQWKIKYKKYKPLTQPKKCTKCLQRTVMKAYYVMCSKCAKENKVCAKCGTKAEIMNKASLSPSESAAKQSRLEGELKLKSERQRRAFYRKHGKEENDSEDELEMGDVSNLSAEEERQRRGLYRKQGKEEDDSEDELETGDENNLSEEGTLDSLKQDIVTEHSESVDISATNGTTTLS